MKLLKKIVHSFFHEWKDTDNWTYEWVEQVCYCGKTRKVANDQ